MPIVFNPRPSSFTLPELYFTIPTVEIASVFDSMCAYLQNYISEFRNPNFYSYTLDGSSVFINDGGGDMYDSGNFTYPWLVSGNNYALTSGNSQASADAVNNINYSASTASTTLDTDFVYRSLGYGTAPDYRPLTVLGYRTGASRPIGFQKSGNLGADGSSGTLVSQEIYSASDVNGFTVYAWYRQVYGAGDPSVCDLYMLIGHSRFQSSFGTVTSYSNTISTDYNGGAYYATNSTNIIAVATLLSKPAGAQITSAECHTVVQNFTSRMKTHLGF